MNKDIGARGKKSNNRDMLQKQIINSLPYILQLPNKDLAKILEKATQIMQM